MSRDKQRERTVETFSPSILFCRNREKERNKFPGKKMKRWPSRADSLKYRLGIVFNPRRNGNQLTQEQDVPVRENEISHSIELRCANSAILHSDISMWIESDEINIFFFHWSTNPKKRFIRNSNFTKPRKAHWFSTNKISQRYFVIWTWRVLNSINCSLVQRQIQSCCSWWSAWVDVRISRIEFSSLVRQNFVLFFDRLFFIFLSIVESTISRCREIWRVILLANWTFLSFVGRRRTVVIHFRQVEEKQKLKKSRRSSLWTTSTCYVAKLLIKCIVNVFFRFNLMPKNWQKFFDIDFVFPIIIPCSGRS